MRKTIASTAVAAGLVLGVAMGCTAQADPPTQAVESSTSGLMSSARPVPIPQATTPTPQLAAFERAQARAQAEIAEATRLLEDAFAKQFEAGLVEQAKLQRMIERAIAAFPEPARMKVKVHIDEVIETGQKLAPKMSPEERSRAVTPPEKLGETQQGQITGWGWGAPAGFGGFGAFGFPGMFAFPGLGGLGGFGSPALWSFPATGFFGTGWGCGWGGAWCGTGLGTGGWFW